jgi:ATP-dependent Clp protease ATP-binding subunit ClpC
MTSNIGSQFIQKMQGFGFSSGHESNEYTNVKEKVSDALKDFFKPEFLNRLDDVIIFDILTKENIEKIVNMQISVVEKRLAEKDITLSVSGEAIKLISEKSYDPKFGARPIRRYVQTHILNKVASMMIGGTFVKGGHVEVTVKNDELSIVSKKKNKISVENILIKNTENKDFVK